MQIAVAPASELLQAQSSPGIDWNKSDETLVCSVFHQAFHVSALVAGPAFFSCIGTLHIPHLSNYFLNAFGHREPED